MKSKHYFVIAALLCTAVMSLTACAPKKPPKAETLHVKVEGMHCEGCAKGITEALFKGRGVLAADVHFSNSVQTVEYDAWKTDAAHLIAVITDRGFTVKPATDAATQPASEPKK